ncbi:MAG TPA: serine/threonine-protein kinase [Kofleriaceae bacterium]|nr:serine/threonine-protein kinase [Kofleriaceae bacterium]
MTDDRLIGTEVGRYRIERLLGEGGMGRVYLAVQPMIGSQVAIKILSDECARSPELLERFFAEARAVNLIRHEGIVNVLDMAVLPDGRPFIVMEFVEGTTLANALHTERLPLGGLVQIMCEVFSALAAAHAIGIVHRDLKPDNVLVTGEGHAKVLDFGIAKLAPGLQQGVSPRTQTGALLGTPHYMSPEQISGKGQVDARSDVYAAGVMLYEAITGRRPFEGETLFDLMRAHLEQPPPSPRALRPELPPAIEHVVWTALAKRPEDRFQSATAMAHALQHAATELPAHEWRPVSSRSGVPMISRSGSRAAPPPSPADFAHRSTVATPPPPPSRRRLWIAAAVLSIVAIVVVIVALSQGGTPPPAQVATAAPPMVIQPTPAPPAGTPPTNPAPANPPPANPAPATPPPAAPTPSAKHATPPAPKPVEPAPATVDKADAAKHGVIIGDNVTVGPGVTIGGGGGDATKPKPARSHYPIDYDPKHFDAMAYAPKALVLARAVYPDAGFVRFDMVNVYPDGHADLTLTDDSASYLFRSPSHSARPTDVPANLPVDITCYVEVTVGPRTIDVRARGMDPTDPNCKWPVRRLPACSMASVWMLAKQAGAKPNTIAKVAFLEDGKWFFDNEYAGDGIVKSFSDHCP